MPQQNWREAYDKLNKHEPSKCADCVINGFGCPVERDKAFIETLVARVIDDIPDGDLLNEGVTSDGIKYQDWSNYNVPIKQELKAKYLTQ